MNCYNKGCSYWDSSCSFNCSEFGDCEDKWSKSYWRNFSRGRILHDIVNGQLPKLTNNQLRKIRNKLIKINLKEK